MSWQTYVDQQLVGTGHVTQAAIIGHDGNVWAASAGFSLKPGEGKGVCANFADPSKAFANGITVSGNKYLAIKADDRSCYGKRGAGGCVTVKTGQAVLIGVYDEKIQPGQAATAVERLGDYLIENGY
eukprot:CAMPEP_0177650844 /NCGR_PEP_ID=MMETSP0447-20121125/12184_1 /TAXON_ID=0 /ORGANISM="Stygamoeba regulata, Strain BSH-02190019" /LENGTH=126 /DNA_ID=CAMNT_0019153791 /DNA_START=105 /DNA_END=485 /DNA_ORIENTATION=-